MFRFRVVQLNRLDWRNFVERTNPLAAALMAKMLMEPSDRPRVKLASLNLLAKLQLDPARRQLISGFVDTYLRLTMEEQSVFDTELNKVEPEQQERVMEIVTSWMEKGIEKGLEQGLEKGLKEGKRNEALSLVSRQLRKRLGSLESDIESRVAGLSVDQLEDLAEALLDFNALSDLTTWLDKSGAR